MTPRDEFEAALREFSKAQLEPIVLHKVGRRLDEITMAEDLQSLVHELVEWLERHDQKLRKLLDYLGTLRQGPGFRQAVEDYHKERFGEVPFPDDPFEALVVFREPFVDRRDFRDRLRDVIEAPNQPVLICSGPRNSGRSHLRWLIKYVAGHRGIEVLFVDLMEEDAARGIDDIVGQVINEMRLPPEEFRDRVAQGTTQARGFSSALKGQARALRESAQHWCLVFDNVDRKEALPEARELVERLILAAAEQSLPNIKLMVLGFDPVLHSSEGFRRTVRRLSRTSLERLNADDVRSFVQELGARAPGPPPGLDPNEACVRVLQGIQLPSENREEMWKVTDRLRDLCLDSAAPSDSENR